MVQVHIYLQLFGNFLNNSIARLLFQVVKQPAPPLLLQRIIEHLQRHALDRYLQYSAKLPVFIRDKPQDSTTKPSILYPVKVAFPKSRKGRKQKPAEHPFVRVQASLLVVVIELAQVLFIDRPPTPFYRIDTEKLIRINKRNMVLLPGNFQVSFYRFMMIPASVGSISPAALDVFL